MLTYEVCRAVYAVIATAIKLMHWKPSAVVGTGGECAWPTCMAAAITRTPLVLIEPNVYPGLINRYLAPFARYIVTAFESPSSGCPAESTPKRFDCLPRSCCRI